ncbi:hypothetical protein Q1695_008042 [Nippostrongylus brasiliensis]|nr:hypothetical protein Q1695_008042 [Nippostrongylus brasiliensis]
MNFDNLVLSRTKLELFTQNSTGSSQFSKEVLTPCAAPPTVAAPIPSTCVRPKPVSFEEFEGKGTVFDELEWKTIDDKLALSQILGKVSLDAPPPPSTPNLEVTTPNPNEHKAPVPVNGSRTVGGPVLPNYPVLDFDPRSKSEEPTVFLSSTGEMSTAVFTKPSAPVKEMPSQPAQGSSLRVRLLTKGYRQNLVDVALARVPRERLQYVEYYMKGMSILEKKGVDADKTVKFLLDSNISDKQAVVQRAQTAEQLIGMGFTAEQVFLGLLTTQGDRVKALDMLLGTR